MTNIRLKKGQVDPKNPQATSVAGPKALKTADVNSIVVESKPDTGFTVAQLQQMDSLRDDLTIEIISDRTPPADAPYMYVPKDGVVSCEKCGENLQYRQMKWSNDQYSGRENIWVHNEHPEYDFTSNASLAKNLNIESDKMGQPVETQRHHSKPDNWCQKCGEKGTVKLTFDSYYDRVTCSNPDCDFEDSRSIGD